ncbi:hypothetical protein SAMN05660706_11937 [Desulfoscipio geothermicus DSM 3669]|uniref:Uncharacterized protein n=1 Tax=Desulfoscipio geothermicus DSM 3669 TaxID=1121426 RepID=A0A1I6DW31_9FIRM|nr:hypothetical protein SAMN05660706_11937 [Desulfoscipio geothermicus DSM 3669]
MAKYARLIPIIILLLVTLITEKFVRSYFIDIGLPTKDTYTITIISVISYILGVISMEFYNRYR